MKEKRGKIMNLLEPKRQKPIIIRLQEKSAYVVVEDDSIDPISLEEKVTITSENYGITIYTADGARYYYKTQSNITNVKIERGYVIIYEKGKSIPWCINMKGLCLRRAKFDESKQSDIEHVEKTYGFGKKEIPYINDYEPCVEFDMLIEPKLDNPITIMLNDENYAQDCYLNKNGKTTIPFAYINPTVISKNDLEETSLTNGVMYSPACPHYGFKVISARKSKVFKTQCRIQGVEIRDDYLHVYEEGKYKPWKIDISLDVEDWAQFLDIYKRDVQYLKDNFGLSIDDVENVNSYGLRYVNKEI